MQNPETSRWIMTPLMPRPPRIDLDNIYPTAHRHGKPQPEAASVWIPLQLSGLPHWGVGYKTSPGRQ